MSGMWVRYGKAGAPAAVVLPGSGSTAEFVARAFAGPLAAAGLALLTADPRPGRSQTVGSEALDAAETWGAALDDLVCRTPVALVGGVSLGAHAAVRWAATRPGRCAGVLCVMPAWTGAPDGVAAVSGATAAELAADGVETVLARLRGIPTEAGWVLDELSRAWRRRVPHDLVAELRGVAASAGPTEAELAALTVPCGVVALRDDPLHPAAVAARWADVLPRAVLGSVGHAQVAADRAVLGRTALDALATASR
jgi:pimeloyl-ACP methyl ester carboxylesterase